MATKNVSSAVSTTRCGSPPQKMQRSPACELGRMALHPVVHRAAEDVVDLDLGVPVRRRHDARLLVADHQRGSGTRSTVLFSGFQWRLPAILPSNAFTFPLRGTAAPYAVL